jgi:hypothetical protein
MNGLIRKGVEYQGPMITVNLTHGIPLHFSCTAPFIQLLFELKKRKAERAGSELN